jgi:hypothetical protein
MSTRDAKVIRISLPPAERRPATPVEDTLPQEIEAMRRADEEHARGETARLEDPRRELRLGIRQLSKTHPQVGCFSANAGRGGAAAVIHIPRSSQ